MTVWREVVPQARGNTLAKAGGDPASSLKNIKVVHYYYYYYYYYSRFMIITQTVLSPRGK